MSRVRLCAAALLVLFPTFASAQTASDSRPNIPGPPPTGCGAPPRWNDPSGGLRPPPRPKGNHRLALVYEWDKWWEMNGGTYVRRRLAAAKAAATLEQPICVFGGASDEEVAAKVSKVTKTQIRNDVLPIVRLGLQDPFWNARAKSAISLGKLVDPANQDLDGILAEVRTLLRDPDHQVRESACLGLGLIGDKSQVSDLLLIMNDDPKGRDLVGARGPIASRLRAFAAIAIGLIGSQDPLDESVIDELKAAAAGAPYRPQKPDSRAESRSTGGGR